MVARVRKISDSVTKSPRAALVTKLSRFAGLFPAATTSIQLTGIYFMYVSMQVAVGIYCYVMYVCMCNDVYLLLCNRRITFSNIFNTTPKLCAFILFCLHVIDMLIIWTLSLSAFPKELTNVLTT